MVYAIQDELRTGTVVAYSARYNGLCFGDGLFRGSIKQAIRLAEVGNGLISAGMTQFARASIRWCGMSNSYSFGQLISDSALWAGMFASMLSSSESAAESGFQGALTVWSFPELPIQTRLRDGWEAVRKSRSLWNSDLNNRQHFANRFLN